MSSIQSVGVGSSNLIQYLSSLGGQTATSGSCSAESNSDSNNSTAVSSSATATSNGSTGGSTFAALLQQIESALQTVLQEFSASSSATSSSTAGSTSNTDGSATASASGASQTDSSSASSTSPQELIQQIFSAIDNVLQQNGITPPDQQGAAPPPFGLSGGQGAGSNLVAQDSTDLASTGQFGGQGSAVNDFLTQNGVSVSQFREALFASAQNGVTSLDLSQLFQNASSGQSVNVLA
jgi:hypothetical protein